MEELVSDRPWARVTRRSGLWLKECRPVQAYEVPLTLALASRWPDRVPEVVDHGDDWMLLRDAGSPVAAFGDFLDAWRVAMPLYAELQQGETAHVDDHLAAGVPDQRVETLLDVFPLWFPAHADRFGELCAQLTIPPTVQHDDLHDGNVYARDGRIVFLDWGDAVVAHPFASLLIAVRSYTEIADTLRDAYLDAWPGDRRAEFDAAYAVAAFARILSWERIARATGDPGSYEARDANIEWFRENIVGS